MFFTLQEDRVEERRKFSELETQLNNSSEAEPVTIQLNNTDDAQTGINNYTIKLQGRLVEKNGLVCINYVNISLLVSGLPQDDIDKYGRIK